MNVFQMVESRAIQKRGKATSENLIVGQPPSQGPKDR